MPDYMNRHNVWSMAGATRRNASTTPSLGQGYGKVETGYVRGAKHAGSGHPSAYLFNPASRTAGVALSFDKEWDPSCVMGNRTEQSGRCIVFLVALHALVASQPKGMAV